MDAGYSESLPSFVGMGFSAGGMEAHPDHVFVMSNAKKRKGLELPYSSILRVSARVSAERHMTVGLVRVSRCGQQTPTTSSTRLQCHRNEVSPSGLEPDYINSDSQGLSRTPVGYC
jgi:hypothetical protein